MLADPPDHATARSSVRRPHPGGESLRASWVALVGLSLVFLFEILDNAILNVALPTIGRQLHASTLGLQWVTGAYAVAFGGLMVVFGVLADRVGRRRVMLVGLALLTVASAASALVTSAEELVVVRASMGVAAAMTTPGSLALAFRLFRSDDLRVKATALISTVGLVGLALGPVAGGFVLSFAPWQALLLVNVPVAILAGVCILRGIARDDPDELYRARPLVDLRVVLRPLVSSGLLYKAGTGLATAGLGFFVTLQLQRDWGWSPFWASIGMLPQVIVLLAGGLIVAPLVRSAGLDRVAWISASAVVAGLAVFALLGRFGYPPVAVALILVALGIRLNGVVAGTNVMKGMPADRTTVGASLVDTATEVATAAGVAVAGSVLAALFAGSVAATPWTAAQHEQFENAATAGGAILTLVAGGLVAWGYARARSTPGKGSGRAAG